LLAASRIDSKGLLPRPFWGAGSSSPSESGTKRAELVLESGLIDRELLFRDDEDIRLGGAASRRVLLDCCSFSYSTEVLRGTAVFDRFEPEAQAVF
jgi:hypothetical protein